MDLNKAMIIGRLTRDPETRTTPNGATVTTFSVATNLVWTDTTGKKQEKVEFHNVVAWRKLGETIAQYLRKGSRIYIEGRLQTRQWQAQDGSNRNRTEIVAESMIMLDGRANAGQPASAPSQPAPTPAPAAPAAPAADSEEIKVEDIPF
ncbi:MAG: single-strand DNA-binding protein [Parcubacteria group bacterium Gr01-1014_31]|nr:MAG: single-strand DNA-binding protein [Parcubacteria group bacterium Gr01-1014_31]